MTTFADSMTHDDALCPEHVEEQVEAEQRVSVDVAMLRFSVDWELATGNYHGRTCH